MPVQKNPAIKAKQEAKWNRPELPPDLARLAELWPSLPEATRAAMLTLAEGVRRE